MKFLDNISQQKNKIRKFFQGRKSKVKVDGHPKIHFDRPSVSQKL